MKPIRMGLQGKLILAFILVLLIPTAIIVTYSLMTTRSILLDKARPDKLKAIEGQVSTIQSRLLRVRDDLLFLSQGQALRTYIKALLGSSDPSTLDSSSASLFLESFLGHAPDMYKAAYVLDLTGQEVVGVTTTNGKTSVVPPSVLENLANQSFFIRTLNLLPGETYISRVDLNKTQGIVDIPYVPVIRYAIPLYTDDGTLAAVFTLKALLQPILATGADTGETIYVVESDGSYLVHPDPNRLYSRFLGSHMGLSADFPAEAADILKQPEGAFFGSQDRPDKVQVFARVTLPGYDNIQWTLIQEEPLGNILKEVNDAYQVILVLNGIALILAIGTGVAITHSIVQPVRALTRTAIAISEGDLLQQVALGGSDEISDLARAFNTMSQEVAETHATLEKRVRERTAELEAANEEIKSFAYIVSHDLRAPLINLKGFAAELRYALNDLEDGSRDVLPLVNQAKRETMLLALQDSIPEALQYIESSVDHMNSFTGAILQLSRLGRRQLELVVVDVRSVVEKTLETLAFQINDRKVQVKLGSLPTVIADLVSMEQIICNILTNAVTYLLPGRPGQIEISGESRVDETIFRVRDNGRGIAQEDMDNVFAPFRRAGKQDVPGEGMGLAYVQTLVRRHGGRIWCESELGVGTTFTFTISCHLTTTNTNLTSSTNSH